MSTTTIRPPGPGELLLDPAEQELLPDALAELTQSLAALDRAVGASLVPLTEPQVKQVMGLVGWMRHRLSRLEVAAAADGMGRGLPNQGGFTETNWVMVAEAEHTQPPTPAHAAQVVRLAKAQADPALAEVMTAMDIGDLSVSKADALARFHYDVKPVADPVSLAEKLDILLEGARDTRTTDPTDPEGRVQRVAGISDRELKVAITRTSREVKPAADLHRDEERARAGRSLYARPGPCGGTTYTVNLDPEGAAVLDAAIAVLSAPVKTQDGGVDPRPPARRRADALVEIVRRGVGAPGKTPRTEKAQVVVTLSLADLLSELRGAGVTMTGQVLSPAMVRKLACDAGIIPVVLGTRGEVLDIGVPKRLFPPGMRKALWLRDQGCSFPGCTIPPQWCDAHHIQHWAHGGPTTVSNGALLCEAHHTYVHKHGLTATVYPWGVMWHT